MGDLVDEEAVDRIAAELRRAPGVLGCLWTGSRERGEGRGLSSDIDLIVCVDESRGPKSRLGFVDRASGRAVEILFRAPSFERGRFQQHVAEGLGGLIHSYAFGRVLFGGDGPLGELVTEARQTWERGPARLPASDREWERYQAGLELADITDRAVTEPATASHLIGLLAGRVVRLAYRLGRRWYPPEKYLLADLQQWDPELAAGFGTAHRDRSPAAERLEALRSLFETMAQRFALDFDAPYESGEPPWRPPGTAPAV